MGKFLRLFAAHGDASELTLLLCGLFAFVGLVARMVGVWP